MKTQPQTLLVLVLLLAGAAGVFCAGITWGLPSRAVDPFLFGAVTPWDGEKILRLAGDRADDPRLGADVDIDPLASRDQPLVLNATDVQRAAIIRRYRLYSYQPDEMITLMALAGMRPSQGRLDPRLYQYGGLWIYPAGALLKLASLTGEVTVISDLAFYLDYPEEFGKFYVVMRLYTVAWALVGVAAVFWLGRRLGGGCTATAAAGALCYALMPVVINMAHEAKPHLPGAVLMLLVVIAAVRYVDTGRRGWWLAAAALCGAALGMVLSALPIFVVLPVMSLLRRHRWREVVWRTVAGGCVGAGVYLVTNPYILINLVGNRDVLRSNFGNSLAMYEISRLGAGLLNAASLVAEGTSPLLAVVGTVGAGIFAWRVLRRRPRDCPEPAAAQAHAAGWLLAVPALVVFAQFVALAAGKPAEYGRFAVFPDVALALAAVMAVRHVMCRRAVQMAALGLLVLVTAGPGVRYLVGFIRDSRPQTSRMRAAHDLRLLQQAGASTLAILAEPAPYNMPPVDLFAWRIVLPPTHEQGTGEHADVLVRAWGTQPFPATAGDMQRCVRPERTRWWRPGSISWANKPFELLIPSQDGEQEPDLPVLP
ncbi:MAG: hypothetical protein GXY55_10790 [Phycisphaerae bacterium]|nr:hypothetical protein [Phycisphaerae bacterium]